MSRREEMERLATRRPEPEAKKEAAAIPPVKVPQKILPERALDDPTFPASPKKTWKAALALEDARVAMTFAVGPLMSGNFMQVLEPECPTLVLWVVRPGVGSMRASWWNRGKWQFWEGWITQPDTKKINHKEVLAWLEP